MSKNAQFRNNNFNNYKIDRDNIASYFTTPESLRDIDNCLEKYSHLSVSRKRAIVKAVLDNLLAFPMRALYDIHRMHNPEGISYEDLEKDVERYQIGIFGLTMTLCEIMSLIKEADIDQDFSQKEGPDHDG